MKARTAADRAKANAQRHGRLALAEEATRQRYIASGRPSLPLTDNRLYWKARQAAHWGIEALKLTQQWKLCACGAEYVGKPETLCPLCRCGAAQAEE